MNSPTDPSVQTPRVGLLVTCLVDVIRPNVGFAAARLLEEAGCEVVVPETQTCCAQPAVSAGDRPSAAQVARTMIDAFEECDYVVGPSGSCLATVRKHYPQLLADDPEYAPRAVALASRTWELLGFLHDVRGYRLPTDGSRRFPCRATYHDSCTGLRELGIRDQARALLAQVPDLELVEMADTDACCGFGGTFCVSYPEISGRMVSEKLRNANETEADVLLGGDLGCLMNIAGRAHREGGGPAVYHVAEVLAGMAGVPAIGTGEEG